MVRFRAKTLTLMVAASFTLQNAAFAARFIDTSGNWSERYINRLSDAGIIPAESDGKFKPDQPITRAQLATWLVKVLHVDNQPVPSTSSYPDVKPSDPFFKAVEIIRQNNYISGYADGFRPHQFIQRAEVMTILSRTLNAPQPDAQQISDELAKYSDGPSVPEWAKKGVAEDSLAGILVNDKDPQALRPTDIATRGETVALLSKLDEYLGKKQIDNAAAAPPTQPPPQTSSAPPAYNPPPQQGGYPPPQYSAQTPPPQGGYGYPPPQYAGQVSAHVPYSSPPPQYAAAGQGQYAPYGGGYQPPPPYLQGAVSTVAAGTKFHAQLTNTLNSGSTQPGEQVQATLGQPLYANGAEVVPAGSKLIGSVTNVVPAKRMRAGANGKIDIRFTGIETPDGRRFPLSASVDGTQVHLTGGTTAGRVGKGLMTTGIGAASGAALGTALGAIVGATSHGGHVGRATGMGAVFGTALGGGVGAVGAVVRKGSEVKFPAGMSLPVQLDQALQVTGPVAGYQPPPPQYGYPPPQQQPYYPPPQQYGGGYGAPPVQTPAGYYPQQQQ